MLLSEPFWYKDAIIYELHVRAFCDSVGDGYGDFRGLTTKLDYLQDLGVTAIWLLPFYPSPLRDDGYDIADYTKIHPQYGNLEDFRDFLSQAHERGLRVITELVLNHTSDQHPWFQRARRAPPESSERNFYVWSDTAERFRGARIIFKDFENSNWTYDQVARAYFWHRFYSHQPDLNFDNPAVWQALLPIVDFWLGMGVDGLRLDAVPYLYEREGTNCENLPETHAFLKAIRRHVDEHFPNRMLLAEANQWPEDAAAYFGQGDECHMAFHFPVMPRLFMGMHMEDRFPVVDILDQTPPIPESCQWALFLRNHDELTLEMVTDEERDYMYRAYAHDRQARVNLGIRRRLAPLLGNNRRRIELMNGLLFSLPGTPVIYYGDEIGMGDNIYLGDRNGVRTPMHWSADRNAGFSRANPQKLYLPIIIDPEYHYEASNVEAQQNNPNSLLWWMKRLVGLKRQHKAFSRGTVQFYHPENRRILAFVRQFEDEHVLVVANLSRFVQFVELDLSQYAGVTPTELFGATPFPRIGTLPYLLTLGPHSFYWFSLSPLRSPEANSSGGSAPAASAAGAIGWPPELHAARDWSSLFENASATQLLAVLRQYVERTQVTGTGRVLRAIHLRETFRIPYAGKTGFLVLVDVEFNRGTAETRVVPIAFAGPVEADAWPADGGPEAIARLTGAQPGLLYNALHDPAFCEAMLAAIAGESRLAGSAAGELVGWRSQVFDDCRGPASEPLAPSLVSHEQTNASIRFGQRLILKAYRRIEEGQHPEREMGRFLTEVRPLMCVAPLAGAIEYRRRRSEPMTLAVVHGYVPNEGDAWQYSLDTLSVFFEQVATMPPLEGPSVAPLQRPFTRALEVPEIAETLAGSYLEMLRHLGRRLGEMHLALASDAEQAEFAPEPFSGQAQRAIYQSMRSMLFDVLHHLERQADRLPPPTLEKVQQLQLRKAEVLRDLRTFADRPIHSTRIRCHGDCHLHQILFTGKDFVFIDFEGRPTQSIGERRIKRSALRDVVSLLRSLDYAAYAALFGLSSGRGQATGVVRDQDRPLLLPWSKAWRAWTSDALLQAYLETCGDAAFLPTAEAERDVLFRTLLTERMLIELAYEATLRPSWLEIPLSGMLEVFEKPEAS